MIFSSLNSALGDLWNAAGQAAAGAGDQPAGAPAKGSTQPETITIHKDPVYEWVAGKKILIKPAETIKVKNTVFTEPDSSSSPPEKESQELHKRLSTILKDQPQLLKAAMRLWNTPLFKRHHDSIYLHIRNVGFNPSANTRLEAASYVLSLVQAGQHKESMDGLATQFLGFTPGLMTARKKALKKLLNSSDPKERAYGAKIKAALKILQRRNRYSTQPSPTTGADSKYGYSTDQTLVRIQEDQKALMPLLEKNSPFIQAYKAEYIKTNEYRSAANEKQLLSDIQTIKGILKDLKSPDKAVRQAALQKLKPLVTQFLSVSALESHVGVGDLGTLMSLYPEDHEDYDQVQVDHDVIDRTFSGADTLDDDASHAEIQNRQDQIDADVKYERTVDAEIKHKHTLINFVRKHLSKAKDCDDKVLLIAKFLVHKGLRNKLVQPFKQSQAAMAGYADSNAKWLDGYITKLYKENDPKKIQQLLTKAKFIAQSGVMLTGIRQSKANHKVVSKQFKKDQKMAYWGARIVTFGIWRPEKIKISAETRADINNAEKHILKAIEIFRDGGDAVDKSNAAAFAKHVKQAQRSLRYAKMGLDCESDLVNGSEASWMRGTIAFGIVAAAVLASCLTAGASNALFPGLGAFAITTISSITFTTVSTLGNHYIMSENVTLGSFAENLIWDRVMFGAFAKIGKVLKAGAGIKVAETAAKTSGELLARIPARYGMAGMKMTPGNIMRLTGKALSKELQVLLTEAGAFQVYEAGKLTFRKTTGLTATPVENYVRELAALFTPEALLHGAGNLMAIRGVGYGSGKATEVLSKIKAIVKVRVKAIEVDIKKINGVLDQHYKGEGKGKPVLSPAAEASLAKKLFHNLAMLHALSGKTAGHSLNTTYTFMLMTQAKAQKAGLGSVSSSFGLKGGEAKAFEKAARSKLSPAELELLQTEATVIELGLREKGSFNPQLRLRTFMLNRILKKTGYKISDGKLVNIAETNRFAKIREAYDRMTPQQKLATLGLLVTGGLALFVPDALFGLGILGMAVHAGADAKSKNKSAGAGNEAPGAKKAKAVDPQKVGLETPHEPQKDGRREAKTVVLKVPNFKLEPKRDTRTLDQKVDDATYNDPNGKDPFYRGLVEQWLTERGTSNPEIVAIEKRTNIDTWYSWTGLIKLCGLKSGHVRSRHTRALKSDPSRRAELEGLRKPETETATIVVRDQAAKARLDAANKNPGKYRIITEAEYKALQKVNQVIDNAIYDGQKLRTDSDTRPLTYDQAQKANTFARRVADYIAGKTSKRPVFETSDPALQKNRVIRDLNRLVDAHDVVMGRPIFKHYATDAGKITKIQNIELQVSEGELYVRSEKELVVNGEKQPVGQWVFLAEGDTVVINGRHYARIQGEMRPIKLAADNAAVLARGEYGIIMDNGDGNVTKLGGTKERNAQLDVEQQALGIIQYHGLGIAPKLIGRPSRGELIIERLNGRSLEDMTVQERQQIPESAWKAFEQKLIQLRELGISQGDLHIGNLMYVPSKQRLYLIDFGKAKIGVRSNSDLAHFRFIRNNAENGRDIQNVFYAGKESDVGRATRVNVPEVPYEVPGHRIVPSKEHGPHYYKDAAFYAAIPVGGKVIDGVPYFPTIKNIKGQRFQLQSGENVEFTGRVFGQGSASTVYEARMTNSKGEIQTVAVKIRDHCMGVDPKQVQREADLLQLADREGMGRVKFHGMTKVDGRLVIVTNVAPGEYFTRANPQWINARTVTEINVLFDKIEKLGLRPGDFQFTIDKTGRVHLMDLEGLNVKGSTAPFSRYHAIEALIVSRQKAKLGTDDIIRELSEPQKQSLADHLAERTGWNITKLQALFGKEWMEAYDRRKVATPKTNEEIQALVGRTFPEAGQLKGRDIEGARLEYEARRDSPSREKLHELIVSQLLLPGTTSERPYIIFTAGAMGAGKSRVLKSLKKSGYLDVEKALLIDPDQIKELIPEYQALKKIDPAKAATIVHRESGKIQELLLARALKLKKNMIVDGTLRNYDYFKGEFARIRREHSAYQLGIVHVDVSYETSLQRAQERAEVTGRHVPESFVRESSQQVPVSVRKLGALADRTIRINNESEPVIEGLRKRDGLEGTIFMPFPTSRSTVLIDPTYAAEVLFGRAMW